MDIIINKDYFLMDCPKIIFRLFPNIPKNGKKIMIDADSVHYISNKEDAALITTIIKSKLKDNNITITDATAGVGGNTISFCSEFKHVNAIEIDNTRFEYLQNNLNVYGITNVDLFKNDCLDVLHIIDKHDVIYIDPPWGGRDYKQYDKLKLSISDMSIELLCVRLMDKSYMKSVPNLIVLKLPLNYNIKHFHKIITKKTYMYTLKKMYIIIIDTTSNLS